MNTTFAILSCTALVALLSTATPAQCTTIGTTPYWESTWAGCLSSGDHWVTNDPVLGSMITLETTNLPITAFAVATLLLLPPTALGTPTNDLFSWPLEAGCNNYLPNAVDYAAMMAWGGSASVPIPIPNNPWWLGKVLHSQSFVIHWDVTITSTNAVCMHVGQ